MSSSNGTRGDAHEKAAEEAWQALFQLFFEGVGQRRFHEACDATGLAPGVLKTLLKLDPGQEVPMRDLAVTFRCDPSYVTSLVDALEEAGLAERRLHPGDRRVRVVAATERGLRTKDEVRKILSQPPDAFEALSTDDLHQLRAVLVKLLAATDTAVNTDREGGAPAA
jgi:MarR family transcriptional regulator, organic hydroperoxide resistance regulator